MDELRALPALLWCVVFIACLGSAVRNLIGRGDSDDIQWMIAWLMSVMQSGHAFRWYSRMLTVSEAPPAFATWAGLQVLSSFIALAILWRRWVRKGFSW